MNAVIFDVDGVLLDSPHERAWREALHDLMTGEWRHLRSTWSPARSRRSSTSGWCPAARGSTERSPRSSTSASRTRSSRRSATRTASRST